MLAVLSSTRSPRPKAAPATSCSTRSEDWTSLVACERIGRQAWLIKLDPKYVETIILPWPAIRATTLDGDGRSYEEIAAGREAAAA